MSQRFRHKIYHSLFFTILMLTSLSAVAAIDASSSSTASFDVISIRLSPPDAGDGSKQAFRPDGYFAKNVTFSMLLSRAYGIESERLVSGLPKWSDTERFDIQAKWGPDLIAMMGSSSTEQKKILQRQLLQSLLVNRFRLRIVLSEKTFGPRFGAKTGTRERSIGKRQPYCIRS